MMPALQPHEGYEDCFSRPRRWALRVWRALAWPLFGWLGKPRVLLIETRWRLGDEIMALPVVADLKARYPKAQVHLWSNYPELFTLSKLNVVANERPPVVHRYILLRGASRRVERRAAYARVAGITRPGEPPRIFPGVPHPRLAGMLPPGKGPLVALCSGAGWPSKRWSPEKWTALATALKDAGCRTLQLGADDDAPISGVDASLLGQTPLEEAAAILKSCGLLIACDSGLMHLALAANVPVVALFGPTDPAFLSDSPRLYPVASPRQCAGFWNHAAVVPAPGECPCGLGSCLTEVSVAMVFERVKPLLSLDKI